MDNWRWREVEKKAKTKTKQKQKKQKKKKRTDRQTDNKNNNNNTIEIETSWEWINYEVYFVASGRARFRASSAKRIYKWLRLSRANLQFSIELGREFAKNIVRRYSA